MKVTAQEEYGLRCILQLARNYGGEPPGSGEPLGSRVIAEREGLSIDYVTKLLMLLRRVGLVQSVRGIKGGFVLACSPKEITINRVMQALSVEDGLIVTSPDSRMCNHFSGRLEECIHLDACGIRPIWMVLSQYISSVLDQITLAELLGEEIEIMEVFGHVTREESIDA